jgi:hypothetical protein
VFICYEIFGNGGGSCASSPGMFTICFSAIDVHVLVGHANRSDPVVERNTNPSNFRFFEDPKGEPFKDHPWWAMQVIGCKLLSYSEVFLPYILLSSDFLDLDQDETNRDYLIVGKEAHVLFHDTLCSVLPIS